MWRGYSSNDEEECNNYHTISTIPVLYRPDSDACATVVEQCWRLGIAFTFIHLATKATYKSGTQQAFHHIEAMNTRSVGNAMFQT